MEGGICFMHMKGQQPERNIVVGVGLLLLALISLFVLTACGPFPDSGATQELQKTTLEEESIANPALWETSTPPPNAATPRAYLAWTGTDATHHLNIMSSPDGFRFGKKRTLGYVSLTAPSLAVASCQCLVTLAWAGTNRYHSLNILSDVYGTPQYLHLDDSFSVSAPSLTYFAGQFWLAWTGVDPTHALNVRALGPRGLTPGPITTLWQDTSPAGPTLSADPTTKQLLLSWAGTQAGAPNAGATMALRLATSLDGVSWSNALPAAASQASAAGAVVLPSATVGANSTNAASAANSYEWAWTGIDAWHSLNVAPASALSNTTGNGNGSGSLAPTTLPEQCTGKPGLAPSATSGQLLVAWTGIDPGQHLNVALITA